MPASTPPIVVTKKSNGLGCVGLGCLIVGLLVLVIGGTLFFAGRQALKTVQAVTSTDPVTIPTADAGPAVYDAAEQKLTTFQQAFERGQPATLRLNTEELNTLIARDPAWEKARGHVAVQLQDSTASLQASVQLGTFENKLMADRYINANVTLGLSFNPATQQFNFDIQTLHMNGQTLPPSNTAGLNQMLNQAVNQQLQANQGARDSLSHVQKADIENGELVIETK